MKDESPGKTGRVMGGIPIPADIFRWLGQVDAPAWITSDDAKLLWLNSPMERFLGAPRANCIGRKCFDVIGARNPEGTLFCSRQCPLRGRRRTRLALRPVKLCIETARGERSTVPVVAIPVPGDEPGSEVLLHIAADVAELFPESFLRRVAERTPRVGRDLAREPLTAREEEILDHLARDETVYEIAEGLHLSHATVRNHVQHILAKMNVHTTLEAVARYVLRRS